MTALTTERTSAAKAGWVVGLVFLAWLAFLFVPFSRKEPPAIPPPPAVSPSRLREVGLRDYPEWDALPAIFAVWADRAEWTGNTTRFAYWNPGANDYTYFFEATRTAHGFRFKEIGKPAEYRVYEMQFPDRVPISEEHPLLLIRRSARPPVKESAAPPTLLRQEGAEAPAPVPIDLPKPDILRPPASIPVNRVPPAQPPK